MFERALASRQGHVQKVSAGILLFRRTGSGLEVLLVHPGGPLWANKDAGAWTIPKGEFEETETPLGAALREFQEETGLSLSGEPRALTPVRQKGGKTVYAWALEGNWDVENLTSNKFQIEWPKGSGRTAEYPEIDRACWFSTSEARRKINAAQSAFIDELVGLISGRKAEPESTADLLPSDDQLKNPT